MKVTAKKNEKVANMIFASIYPLYLNRLEKNGRTKEELNQVIIGLLVLIKMLYTHLLKKRQLLEHFFKKQK